MHITLNELIEKVSGIVQGHFKKAPDESIPPTFFAVKANGHMAVLITPWQNEEEKVEMLEEIKQLFSEEDVVSYCLVSEAWMSKTCLDEGIAPSESSDRIEVVLLTASSHTETQGKALRMIRGENGDIIDLELMPENQEVKSMQGRMTTLLTKTHTIH
ncbi:MAG: hypothetical protein JWO62_3809 [Acidimicrobiaceae bacterium]|nr:hypothetical protein [Acidimicrobiaceae bacterium]